MGTIAVLGTFDTKGHEHAFLAGIIRSAGHEALLIDVGTTNRPQVPPDVRVTEIVPAFSRPDDRGACVSEVAARVPEFVASLAKAGRIDGVISLGGGGGTSIATAAMRALPLGMPKVMVSTLASGNTAHYVGTSDIVMVPAIVDVAGLNRVSKGVFTSAARAVCAMVETREALASKAAEEKPLVLASMFGNTTGCIDVAKAEVEAAGFEVLVFHATGTGGRTMESLILSGIAAGVLDVTTTEIADEVVGGVLSAGPHRLESAADAGIPVVVAPGCVDMVNFGARETVPERFNERTFYQHNDQVTLMRTNAEENVAIATFIADKLNQYRVPPVVALPLGGVSVISESGGPFHDDEADRALFTTLKERLRPEIAIHESPHVINDPEFARLCVDRLLEQIPPVVL